ncbi:MAG: phosphotransferase [Gemmatimonadetes bacterium]|uniref:Phosphotransferase n=1 Tax=Candidatus Kutchimonas denitrificans TaxID=3056748 RepID=A0AAE5CBE5_9BACT|nr:phosphotransferase [Gemmatimonadota bacterium]NIR75752.1 phosphotransferase [Candidatus Kutchimonas denitrificans]NIS00365.1 phosphotransferase [Gemmatimonadota bacterium]NIT66024.1 phosphotransferase [Gemmatimonadota bacterium]NIU53728.1 phosphotransferase [Gemmatimonadota bacterium]
MTFSDPALPGLAMALDPDALLSRLGAEVRRTGRELDLEEARILDVQYRPGTTSRILYRLRMRDHRAGRSARQLVSVHLARAGTPEPQPRAEILSRYGGRPEEAFPWPVLHLPDGPMTLCAFPVDAALPWLFDAVDPDAVKRALGRMWGDRRVRVRRVKPKPLAYTPEARATLTYEVLSESKGTGVPELRRLIGKMHGRKPAARRHAGAWALWRVARDRLNLAPPVGQAPGLNLTFEERLEGVRLTELSHLGTFESMVRRAARAIGFVHGLDLPLAPKRAPQKEAQVVRRWVPVLCALCPEQAPRIERLGGRLAAEIEARARVCGIVHGDFHPANVLVGDRRVMIVDLDDLALGDPLLDVGRFLASLRVSALRLAGVPSALDAPAEAFLAEYLSRTPDDERRARLFEAVSLLVAAAGPFRLQRAGWREAAAMLVDLAEEALARASAPSAVVSGGAPDRGDLRVADPTDWASDGHYVSTLLDPHIRDMYGAEIGRCRVVRRSASGEKAGETERLRYELRGWREDEPWTLSLQGILQPGGGRGAVSRVQALRRSLESTPDAPILPRPVAYLKLLSLSVWEIPSGQRLSTLLDDHDALGAVPRVARALAALHGASVPLDRSRSRDQEMRSLRARVDGLEGSHPQLLGRAEQLFLEVERRTEQVRQPLVPALRTLNPHHVLVNGEGVGFDKVEKLTLTLPQIDVADFLAHLSLAGIDGDVERHTNAVADCFRAHYLARGGPEDDGIAPFEAAALLGLACQQARQDDERRAKAERLVQLAEARLTTG